MSCMVTARTSICDLNTFVANINQSILLHASERKIHFKVVEYRQFGSESHVFQGF